MKKAEKYSAVIDWFSANMPIAESELHFNSPYELVVSVILSAQCTDKRVNIVAPTLFDKFPTAEALAKAEVEEIYLLIKSVSYPNNKAKNLSGMAKMLTSVYGGVLPQEPEELQKLPGVGRKTANVVSSILFDKKVIAVDTHVFRVAARIGLVKNAKTPLATEQQLTKNFPKDILPIAHHWLILHGRYVCTARKPHCEECGLTNYCDFYKNIL